MSDGRWKIRYNNHNHLWDVWTPDRSWSGSFTAWHEAIGWATDPFERMQYWMANQPGIPPRRPAVTQDAVIEQPTEEAS